MLKKFKEKIEKISGECFIVRNKKEALAKISSFLQQGNVVWLNQDFLKKEEEKQLALTYPNLSFNVELKNASQAYVGINEADYAILETGTIVEIANPPQKVLCSTLPNIHIVLLSPSVLLYSLTDFILMHNWSQGYVSFITGPSKTADIEGILTLGVHGPEKLIVICVEDWIK